MKRTYQRMLRAVQLGALLAVVVGIAIAIVLTNLIVFGAVLAIIGVITLVVSGDPIQRWLLQREGRSVLGGFTDIHLTDEGITSRTPLGEGSIPWAAVTAVRESERIVVFMRDRIPIAYIPDSSFESPARRAEIMAYARERMSAAGMGDTGLGGEG